MMRTYLRIFFLLFFSGLYNVTASASRPPSASDVVVLEVDRSNYINVSIIQTYLTGYKETHSNVHANIEALDLIHDDTEIGVRNKNAALNTLETKIREFWGNRTLKTLAIIVNLRTGADGKGAQHFTTLAIRKIREERDGKVYNRPFALYNDSLGRNIIPRDLQALLSKLGITLLEPQAGSRSIPPVTQLDSDCGFFVMMSLQHLMECDDADFGLDNLNSYLDYKLDQFKPAQAHHAPAAALPPVAGGRGAAVAAPHQAPAPPPTTRYDIEKLRCFYTMYAMHYLSTQDNPYVSIRTRLPCDKYFIFTLQER